MVSQQIKQDIFLLPVTDSTQPTVAVQMSVSGRAGRPLLDRHRVVSW